MGAPLQTPVSNEELGRKLAESAALFEAGLAAILQAESEKIERILSGLPEDAAFTRDDLIDANAALREIIGNLLNLETEIIAVIRQGIRLMS